jgi:hypothetical protein
MDPLSTTTGVVSLTGACFKVGVELKEVYNGAAIADAAVEAMLQEVEGFSQTLQLMKKILQQPDVHASMTATDHISNHWSEVLYSARS